MKPPAPVTSTRTPECLEVDMNSSPSGSEDLLHVPTWHRCRSARRESSSARIRRSSASDQLSMYSRSSSTQRSKSRLLRPCTCHRHVSPGRMLKRRMSEGRVMRSHVPPRQRARTHQRHVATQNVPELRQFVERRLAQQPPERRDSRIILDLEHRSAAPRSAPRATAWQLIGIRDHRPELVHPERPLVESRTDPARR